MGKEKLALVAVADIGNSVAKIFSNPKTKNTNVWVCSDQLKCSEIAEIFSKVLDIQCSYYEVDDDTFRSFEFPGAKEIGNMLAYYRIDS